MDGNFIGLVATIMVFSVPLSAIWLSHQKKMAELQLKLRQGGQDNTLRASVEALREEVRALRDTTTQYDLSFDTALQNIENRVQAVERQNYIAPQYQMNAPRNDQINGQANEDTPQKLTLGGRP